MFQLPVFSGFKSTVRAYPFRCKLFLASLEPPAPSLLGKQAILNERSAAEREAGVAGVQQCQSFFCIVIKGKRWQSMASKCEFDMMRIFCFSHSHHRNACSKLPLCQLSLQASALPAQSAPCFISAPFFLQFKVPPPRNGRMRHQQRWM